jgi:hypothetical protein
MCGALQVGIIRFPVQALLAKTVRQVSNAQEAVKLEAKAPPPLAYEADAMTIKTPDGRMRLVNQ